MRRCAAAVVRRVRWAARGDESGQLIVLIIGFTLLCLLVAATVMGVSAVHIEHRRLLSAADGAASAAADSFTLAGGDSAATPTAALKDERVHGAVTSYLVADGAAARFDGFAVASATGTPDGRTATVSLVATAHVPIVGIFLPDGVPIQATSSARARLVR